MVDDMENKVEEMIINDGNSDKKIYPLLELDKNNKNYLIYSDILSDELNVDHIFAGELKDNSLLPITDEELLMLEGLYRKIIESGKKE